MSKTRFQSIVSGACPAPLYDTILWDLGDVVVTPTLGSIVPHWVLAIPRRHAVNFSAWCQDDRSAPQHYVNEIAKRAARPADGIIWFEHGSTTTGSVTGCGVDHAHMHLLLQPLFEFEKFIDVSLSIATDLKWQRAVGNPYDHISPNRSYLVAGKGNDFLIAQNVDRAGSQFFRRVVAAVTAQSKSWDYRSHPHLENVALTVATARQAA